MNKKEKAFDVAVSTRSLEITLFWQRSIFFWGFIAAAFVGYASLKEQGSDLSLLMGCFGLVCSVAWTLANRGSKFWQESWEKKVERFEGEISGPLFSVEEDVEVKGSWLGPRRYSVTKLTFILGDYTAFLWFGLVSWELVRMFAPIGALPPNKQFFAIIFVGATIAAIAAMFCDGKSKPREST